jgi:hypothetical protein
MGCVNEASNHAREAGLRQENSFEAACFVVKGRWLIAATSSIIKRGKVNDYEK